jgi:hypothetical protein
VEDAGDCEVVRFNSVKSEKNAKLSDLTGDMEKLNVNGNGS